MLSSLTGAAEWVRRASRYLGPGDLLRINPYTVLKTFVDYARQAPGELPTGDLQARDPELVRVFVDLFRALGRHYFRFQVQGLEHLPPSGPALLVGNHNGGPLPIDSLLTLVAVWDHLGPERALHPLAHDLLFFNDLTRRFAVPLGVLRARHQSGAQALRAGRLVLVYPGSDLDAARPFAARHRVDLGGRTGFLKLALREGVPIVPVVSTGTHEQFVVLSRGDAVVRALGLKRRFRVEVFPIVLSLPWGLTSGFFPYWPLPAQTTLRFGPPISFPHLGPAAAEDPAALAACYEEVRARMQGELDRLAAGRLPLLGQRAPRRAPGT